MRKYWLLWATLIALSVVIILPPIMNGYVYPTAGDDTAYHLIYFSNMENMPPLYLGQALIGGLLNWLPLDINVSFLWFHYIVLVSITWMIGITLLLTVNMIAAIFGVILAVFGVSQLLNLFYYGQIFDLIGIGLLLPTALLCLHKRSQSVAWRIGAVITLAAFMIFHANGVYILALLPIIVVYEWARPKVAELLNGRALEIWNSPFLMYTLLLGINLVILFIMGIGQPDPARLYMDASILLAIFLGGVIGILLNNRAKLLTVISMALVFAISIPNVFVWLQNNSAVKNVDKEAIAYLNDLNGKSYTASPQVMQNIYSLFVEKQFDETTINADYALIRSVPMTPQSDPDSFYFKNGDRIAITIASFMNKNGYRLLQEFDCGEIDRVTNLPIIIDIYGRGND